MTYRRCQTCDEYDCIFRQKYTEGVGCDYHPFEKKKVKTLE
jgi:hypothetical protein